MAILFLHATAPQNPLRQTKLLLLFRPQLHLSIRRLFLPGAASISGSTSDFPERLAGGAQRPRKRRSIAGVDQEELLDPSQLADPDSAFCDLNGVLIHHKLCHHDALEDEKIQSLEPPQIDGRTRIGLPMILLHGFGASVFSWDRVMRPLARITGSKVLAFDRPAFGLTARKSSDDALPLNPYSMAFSVLATISFINMLGAHKAILMGHSAGCLVAVNTYFEAPEKVAGLILVAPAIIAPLIPPPRVMEEDGEQKDNKNGESLVTRVWNALSKLCMLVVGVVLRMLQRMREMMSSMYAKALAAFLRSTLAVMLVRMVMDKFGVLAIRNAWYDANKISDHVIQGYTKPLKAKGWDKALLEYTLAMLADSSTKSKPVLSKRLAEISCPVLVVTGDADRLVPSWNAERLARAIQGSTFEVIKNCGHLPHEERVEEFLSAVERFLQIAFGVKEGEFSSATT